MVFQTGLLCALLKFRSKENSINIWMLLDCKDSKAKLEFKRKNLQSRESRYRSSELLEGQVWKLFCLLNNVFLPRISRGDHVLYRMDMFNCKKVYSRLEGLLIAGPIETVRLLYLADLEKPHHPIYEEFLNILNNAAALVKKCEKTNRFNIFQSLTYASQIHQLEREILDIVQYWMPVQLSLDVDFLMTDLKSVLQLYELGSMAERKINEAIVRKLANDSNKNATMLQQMGPDNMFDGGFYGAPACSYSSSLKSDFVVVLEKIIWNLKRILLQREVSVVGEQGLGGTGKTTMAMVLSDDKKIQGAFRNIIIFITVLQSSNLKVILETMWEKIVRGQKPEFQSMEDAHRQLLRQAMPTLVVSNDIWSRASLEILLCEDEGYKTFVTTCSTISTTTSNQSCELPSVDDADALPLFDFWTNQFVLIISTTTSTTFYEFIAG